MADNMTEMPSQTERNRNQSIPDQSQTEKKRNQSLPEDIDEKSPTEVQRDQSLPEDQGGRPDVIDDGSDAGDGDGAASQPQPKPPEPDQPAQPEPSQPSQPGSALPQDVQQTTRGSVRQRPQPSQSALSREAQEVRRLTTEGISPERANQLLDRGVDPDVVGRLARGDVSASRAVDIAQRTDVARPVQRRQPTDPITQTEARRGQSLPDSLADQPAGQVQRRQSSTPVSRQPQFFRERAQSVQPTGGQSTPQGRDVFFTEQRRAGSQRPGTPQPARQSPAPLRNTNTPGPTATDRSFRPLPSQVEDQQQPIRTPGPTARDTSFRLTPGQVRRRTNRFMPGREPQTFTGRFIRSVQDANVGQRAGSAAGQLGAGQGVQRGVSQAVGGVSGALVVTPSRVLQGVEQVGRAGIGDVGRVARGSSEQLAIPEIAPQATNPRTFGRAFSQIGRNLRSTDPQVQGAAVGGLVGMIGAPAIGRGVSRVGRAARLARRGRRQPLRSDQDELLIGMERVEQRTTSSQFSSQIPDETLQQARVRSRRQFQRPVQRREIEQLQEKGTVTETRQTPAGTVERRAVQEGNEERAAFILRTDKPQQNTQDLTDIVETRGQEVQFEMKEQRPLQGPTGSELRRSVGRAERFVPQRRQRDNTPSPSDGPGSTRRRSSPLQSEGELRAKLARDLQDQRPRSRRREPDVSGPTGEDLPFNRKAREPIARDILKRRVKGTDKGTAARSGSASQFSGGSTGRGRAVVEEPTEEGPMDFSQASPVRLPQRESPPAVAPAPRTGPAPQQQRQRNRPLRSGQQPQKTKQGSGTKPGARSFRILSQPTDTDVMQPPQLKTDQDAGQFQIPRFFSGPRNKQGVTPKSGQGQRNRPLQMPKRKPKQALVPKFGQKAKQTTKTRSRKRGRSRPPLPFSQDSKFIPEPSDKKQSKKRKGRRGFGFDKIILSDPLSVSISRIRYGQATSPRNTPQLIGQARSSLYSNIPTVEQLTKSNRKEKINTSPNII